MNWDEFLQLYKEASEEVKSQIEKIRSLDVLKEDQSQPVLQE